MACARPGIPPRARRDSCAQGTMWQIDAPFTSPTLRTSPRHRQAPARCGEETAHDPNDDHDPVRLDSDGHGPRHGRVCRAGGEPAGECPGGGGEPEYRECHAARNAARHRQGCRRADHRVPPEERRLQEAGRLDERARHRRKELSQAEAAGNRRDGESRTVTTGTGRGRLACPRPPAFALSALRRGRPGSALSALRRGRPGFAIAARRRGRPAFAIAALRWVRLAGPGYSLIELMFVVAIAAVLAGATVPMVLGSLDRSRGLIAAKYLGSRFALARTMAVTRRASVGLRFVDTPQGISFQVYQDGNRNGILSADIEKHIDQPIEPAT